MADFTYNFPNGLVAGTGYNFATYYLGSAIPTRFKIGNDFWDASTTFTWGKQLQANCQSFQILPAFGANAVFAIAPGTVYADNTLVYPVTQCQTAQPFTAVAQGNAVDVFLSIPFAGNIGDSIYINGHKYTVNSFDNTQASYAPELPAARMGCNSGGRTWVALPDGKSYVGSDLTGDPSGTAEFGFTDAVLKMTENALLSGGGAFRVPAQSGNISAMVPTATLDASLGQGPLEIFTPTQIFSCNAPPDRTTWASLQYPIQSVSLIGAGSLSQWATFNANSDTLFRAADGIRSLVLARRDFNVWGNVPNSEEVTPILSGDNQALLNFASGINFDNRALFTADPVQTPQGTYFDNLIALNFDPVSSLAGKQASVYDGVWTGINVLQLLTGSINGLNRAFAITLNKTNGKIELYEILPSLPDPDFLPIDQVAQWSDLKNQYDNGTTPIPMSINMPVLTFGQNDPMNRHYLSLNNGEITCDHMTGDVNFEVWYQPDDQPVWTLWHAWTEHCSTTQPEFRPRMGLGTPTVDNCDPVTNRPMREGYQFSVKVIIVGNARFKGGRFSAVTMPQPKYQPPRCPADIVPTPPGTITLVGGEASTPVGQIPGPVGPVGPRGIQGPAGTAGAPGPAGPGVAPGGTANQVLAKIDSTDFNTHWVNQSGGGGATDILQVQVFT